jgi:hypothetical protein
MRTTESEPMTDERPRELLVDDGLEKCLLGAMMLTPSIIAPVFEVTGCHQFGMQVHQKVARAIELVATDDVVNAPNVARMLRKMGQLEFVGGTAFLLDLEETTPITLLEDALSWAEKVRDLWQRRAILNEARLLVAQLELNSIDDAFEAAAQLPVRVESYRPTPIIEIGRWVEEMQDATEPPPPQSWLLYDDQGAESVPAIPLGRAMLLSAAGGTGKTTTLAQLAVAVALGLTWCGLRVCTPGPVVYCCGESDEPLMLRHLWRAYNSFDLTSEQRRYAAANILGIPMMGKQINIIGNGARGDFTRTPFLTQLRERLTREALSKKIDWSLVIFDPLSRFAGPDTEKDNSAATQFVSAVETLCTLPGTPTTLCAHHSSKTSASNGKNDARGVSGIVDGFRSNTVLTRLSTPEGIVGVQMSNVKNNEAPHFADRWLVQQAGALVGGTLRLATEAEAVLLTEANKPKKARERPAPVLPDKPNLHDAIVKALRDVGGQAQSRNWLWERHLSGFRKADVWDAFGSLIAQGEVTIDASGASRGTVRLPSDEPVQTTLGGIA